MVLDYKSLTRRKKKARMAKIEVAGGCGKRFEKIKSEKMEIEGNNLKKMGISHFLMKYLLSFCME